MVLNYNPLEYLKSIFDIVEYINLEQCKLKWYSCETKKVSAEFEDNHMMLINLDDIITIDGKYVQTFKLTCPEIKLDLCKKVMNETQLNFIFLPITILNDLIEVKFYVEGDFIPTEIEAEQIG